MPSPSTTAVVLLVRLSAIGDIVMASGLPSNIKSAFPNAKVVWLVESPYRELVEYHPDVDAVISWPKKHWSMLKKNNQWLSLFREIRRFKQHLRQYQFTHAIDAQGLLKSAFLAWLSGAPKRIGFASKEKSHVMLTEVYDKPMSAWISSEYRYLGKKLGDERYTMNLAVTDSATKNAHNALIQAQLSAPFIVVCPFTTRPQKHWPESHWRALLETLNEQHKAVVIIGAPENVTTGDRLAKSLSHVHNFSGKTSLLDSVALIKQASILVGVDTGMTHVGIAFNLPTVAIFGSTRPYTKTDNANAKVLYESMPCAPCKRKPSCDGRFDCMQNLSPTRVYQALEEFVL